MQAAVGNYVLLRPLGEGGMGTVYLAEHIHMRYHAVVKSLHPHYVQNEGLVQRFYAEAQVMAQVSHPAIVRLYDFVIQDGVPYLIMEYVQGTPLSEWIAGQGALSPEKTYTILAPIWEALEYLHRRKIIHRDIKPSNIVVLPEGGAKLIDFGIAKALNADYKLTQTGMQVGTVLYMAPEQIKGLPVSPQTDLYAMGLVTYECLFGHFPWEWQGKTQFQLYQMLLTEEPPLPAWIPAGWQEFFGRALAKEPAERFGSAQEMRTSYEALVLSPSRPERASGSGSSLLGPGQADDGSPASPGKALSSPTPASPAATPSRTSPRPPGVAILIIIMAVGVGVAIGVLSFIRAKKRREALKKEIYSLVSAYTDGNKAAFQKVIVSNLKKDFKEYDNFSVQDFMLYEPSIESALLTNHSLERFDEGEFISVFGEVATELRFSSRRVGQVKVEEECIYETPTLFGWRRERGTQWWAYEVVTPVECQVRILLPCEWQVQKGGYVKHGVEQGSLRYADRTCSEGQPRRTGKGWPISECE